MKLRLLALMLTIMAFISCDDAFKNHKFQLSNPTDKEITVTIDDKDYVLAANSFQDVKILPGKHNLVYNGKKTLFNVFSTNTGGIINPTLEPHYIYSMVYATEGNFDKFKSLSRPVYIDGILYEDNIKSTNALFIDNNFYRCTYDIGTPYPEEMITHNKTSIGNFYNKFFTKQEFIDFISSEADEEYKNFHEENKDINGENTITEKAITEVAIPNIDNEELINSYKKELELVNERIHSEDKSRQKEIQKELFDLSMKRSKIDVDYRKNTTEQNQAMNDFVSNSGKLSGAGIIELQEK